MLLVINRIDNATSGPASMSDTLHMIGDVMPTLLIQLVPLMFIFPLLFLPR